MVLHSIQIEGILKHKKSEQFLEKENNYMIPKDKDYEVNFNLNSTSIDMGGETNPFKFQNRPSNQSRG